MGKEKTLERLLVAFSGRKMPPNPSILPGPDHTEYYNVARFMDVDWNTAGPEDMNECSGVLPILNWKGFPFLLLHILRLSLIYPREMRGNEMMLQFMEEISQEPSKFMPDPRRERYVGLSHEEIAAFLEWVDWAGCAEFSISLNTSEMIKNMRANIQTLPAAK